MSKKTINKTAICEISQLFSTITGCCGNNDKYDCANCQYNWDCMMFEIASQVHAMGYFKTENPKVSNQAVIEETAKEIARARGYGCDDHDCCEKCTCATMLNYIPLQLAHCLIEAGYEKKEG